MVEAVRSTGCHRWAGLTTTNISSSELNPPTFINSTQRSSDASSLELCISQTPALWKMFYFYKNILWLEIFQKETILFLMASLPSPEYIHLNRLAISGTRLVIYQLYKLLPDLTTGADTTDQTRQRNAHQAWINYSLFSCSIQLAWGPWPLVSLLDYNDKFMPITLITVGTQAVPYNVIPGKMAVGIGHDYHYRECYAEWFTRGRGPSSSWSEIIMIGGRPR